MLVINDRKPGSIGEIFRLRNPKKADLEVIEFQSRSYLGEDDIVRFDNQYGRQGTDAQ